MGQVSSLKDASLVQISSPWDATLFQILEMHIPVKSQVSDLARLETCPLNIKLFNGFGSK